MRFREAEMDKYEIIGTYRGESEVVDTAKDRQEAEYLRGEYQLAFGNEWVVKIKKVRG